MAIKTTTYMRFYQFFLLVMFCHHVAASAPSDLFRGRVVNASRDSIGVSDQQVQLFAFSQNAIEPKLIASTRTTGDGRFRISIAEVDSSVHYLAATDHQGVRYYSEPKHPKSASHSYDIIIFDSTHSAQTVRGLMHHVFIQHAGKTLAVRESRILENYSNKTIVQAIADEHETDAIFRILLPANAQNITPISGHSDELRVHGHLLYDTGVFQPGRRQISFAYEIPWQKDGATFEVDVHHHSQAFDVFIADANITLQGEGWVDQGPFNIRGVTYRRYSLQSTPEKRIRLLLTQSAATVEDDALPIRLLIITSVALLLSLGFAWMRGVKSKSTLSSQERQQLLKNRRRLIEEIARLELAPEMDIYSQQKRQELFEELQKIEWTLQQGQTGPKTGKP